MRGAPSPAFGQDRQGAGRQHRQVDLQKSAYPPHPTAAGVDLACLLGQDRGKQSEGDRQQHGDGGVDPGCAAVGVEEELPDDGETLGAGTAPGRPPWRTQPVPT